ncbi:MAG: TatD family hydrolase [Prevotellaceae bacterium]|jgi:TatD DNase family protein|nr:TatD family hydrolase [Prevotellaceae bacterium]
MAPYIDIHTHCRATTQNIQVLVLNPTEWRNILYSVKEFYSVGIHPWHSNDRNIAEQLEWLEEALQKTNVLALGEVGLDRSINIPLGLQESVLKAQIRLSKHHLKPLVFHAARTTSDILSICKQKKVYQPFIVHGFTGKPEAVQQISRAGGYVSFGAKIIENRSWDEALKEAYKLNNFFFETDEAAIEINAVYQKAAEVLEVDTDQLKEQVYAYFCEVFGKAVQSLYATE